VEDRSSQRKERHVVYFARSPLGIIVASLCSMAIIAFTYFVIVQPQIDNANDQVNDSLRQFAPNESTNTPSINDAQKLQACITKAGTDTVKIQACTDKYR
jgi:hypothetical protein